MITIVTSRCGGEGRSPRAVGVDGVSLSGGYTAGPQAVARHGRGGVDLRGVADGAVAPRPPDADVVVLAGQVSLCGGHRARARVPVEAGDCTLAG